MNHSLPPGGEKLFNRTHQRTLSRDGIAAPARVVVAKPGIKGVKERRGRTAIAVSAIPEDSGFNSTKDEQCCPSREFDGGRTFFHIRRNRMGYSLILPRAPMRQPLFCSIAGTAVAWIIVPQRNVAKITLRRTADNRGTAIDFRAIHP
jgi:hypothetical protein